MADTKISNLTADTSPTSDDLLVTVNDPAGTPANKKVAVSDLATAFPKNHSGETVGGGGDVNVADTNYVAVASATVSIAAGDIFTVDADFLILNNSGGTKTYTCTLNVNGLQVEVVDGGTVGASATNRAYFTFHGACEVRSTSLVYAAAELRRSDPVAANTANSNTNANLRKAWNTSTSDLTGSSKVVKLEIKSSANTTTQTLTLLAYRIKKQ
jgi:hypothetical protein